MLEWNEQLGEFLIKKTLLKIAENIANYRINNLWMLVETEHNVVNVSNVKKLDEIHIEEIWISSNL